jgi:hypothetical protein
MRAGRFDSVTVVWVASVKVSDVVEAVPFVLLDGADGLPQAAMASIVTNRSR